MVIYCGWNNKIKKKKKHSTQVQICNLSHGFHHTPILTVFNFPARAKKKKKKNPEV